MFYDRIEAGQKLSKELKKYKSKKNVLVLGMPRGGVVTANQIAGELKLNLDIMFAKKIGSPQNPEFAIGAVAQKGEPILNDDLIGTGDITPDYLDKTISQKRVEINKKILEYRKGKSQLNLKGKNVILVDDGIATGMSILAAINQIKSMGAKKIVVATPVIPADGIDKIKKQVDELIYLEAPDGFFAVGQFYDHFDQISDDEVKKILADYN